MKVRPMDSPFVVTVKRHGSMLSEIKCSSEWFVVWVKRRAGRAGHFSKSLRRWRVRVSLPRGSPAPGTTLGEEMRQALFAVTFLYLGRVKTPRPGGVARAVRSASRLNRFRHREPSCVKRGTDGKTSHMENLPAFPAIPRKHRSLFGSAAKVSQWSMSSLRWIRNKGEKPGFFEVIAGRLHRRAERWILTLQRKDRKGLVVKRRTWRWVHSSFVVDWGFYIVVGQLRFLSPQLKARGGGDVSRKTSRVPLIGRVCPCGLSNRWGLLTGRRYCSRSCWLRFRVPTVMARGALDASLTVGNVAQFLENEETYHFGGWFNPRRFG